MDILIYAFNKLVRRIYKRFWSDSVRRACSRTNISNLIIILVAIRDFDAFSLVVKTNSSVIVASIFFLVMQNRKFWAG